VRRGSGLTEGGTDNAAGVSGSRERREASLKRKPTSRFRRSRKSLLRLHRPDNFVRTTRAAALNIAQPRQSAICERLKRIGKHVALMRRWVHATDLPSRRFQCAHAAFTRHPWVLVSSEYDDDAGTPRAKTWAIYGHLADCPFAHFVSAGGISPRETPRHGAQQDNGEWGIWSAECGVFAVDS
jgi:hypothetical protein